MNKISFEEYLNKYHTFTYKNVGVSMLPLLKQGRDSFTVREVKAGQSCNRWDVVLYRRNDGQYVLHRIIRVHEESYDILGDNCIGIEYRISKDRVIGVMTDYTHRGRMHSTSDFAYRIYLNLWCKPYKLRILLKKLWSRWRNSALGFIGKVVGIQKIDIYLLALLQVLLGGSSIFYAFLLRNIIDGAVTHSKEQLCGNLLLFTGLMGAQLALRAVIRWLEELSKATYENLFKYRLFREIMSGDYGEITKTHSGEWLNRLTSDTAYVSEGLVTIVPGVAGMVTKLTGAMAVLLIIEPDFGLVLLCGGVLFVILSFFFRRKLKRIHKNMQEKDGAVRIFLQEHLESLAVLKVFGREEYSLSEAERKMDEHKKARMKKNHFSNLCNIGFGGVMSGAYLLAAAYSAFGIYNGTMTYGTLTALLQLTGQIQGPVANITGYLPKYYVMLASAERLRKVEACQKDSVHAVEPAERVRAIYDRELKGLALNKISFSYQERMVLRDVTLFVPKGESIAVTGGSGCGKSTLLKLLIGLYEPQGGSVDAVCVGEQRMDVGKLRSLFAYVPQGNYLMHGSVREAITFGVQGGNIERAVSLACAEFIYALSGGLDAMLGERGAGLSEGQMQRIAIARALYTDAPVLILDEATSALDGETEERLLHNLKQLTDKTILLVTHRLSAAAMCDRQWSFTESGEIEIKLRKES